MPQALAMHPQHTIQKLGKYLINSKIIDGVYLKNFLYYDYKIGPDYIQDLNAHTIIIRCLKFNE